MSLQSALTSSAPVARRAGFDSIPNGFVMLVSLASLLALPLVSIAVRLQFVDKTIAAIGVVAFTIGFSVVVLLLLGATRPFRVGRRLDWAAVFMTLLFAVTVLSSVLAAGSRADPMAMWRQLIGAFAPAGLYLVFREFGARAAGAGGISAALSVYFGLALGSIALEVTGLLRVESFLGRNFGVLGDDVAWMLSLGVVYGFSRRGWLVACACTIGLALTASRMPLFVTVIAVAFMVFTQPAKSAVSFGLRATFLLGLGAFILLLPNLLPVLYQRLVETSILKNDRLNTTEFSLRLFAQSPVIGSGYNYQAAIYAVFFGRGAEGFSVWSNPTSTAAQILTDSGVLGGLCFVGFAAPVLGSSIAVARMQGHAPEPQRSLVQLARRAGSWLFAFILFNQSAAYLIPSNLLAVLVFALAGFVQGFRWASPFGPEAHAVMNSAEDEDLQAFPARG